MRLALPAILASAAPANGVSQALRSIFSERYLPHRFCYLAQPGLIWSNAISDALIALSYVALFSYLMFIARRLRRLPEVREYIWILVAFGAFILTCGATHMMDVITVWWPFYPVAAVLKVACAAVSVPTAVYFSAVAPTLSDSIEEFIRSRREAIERGMGLPSTANRAPRATAGVNPAAGSTRSLSKETILLKLFSRGLLLAILLNVAFSLTLWQSTLKQAADSDAVAHTQTVSAALLTTLRQLQDVVMGGRLFSLIGAPDFLTSYRNGKAAVFPDIAELRRLTADNPAQQRRLDTLGPQVQSAVATTDALITARRNFGTLPSESRIQQGKQLMDQAENTVYEMQAEEGALLDAGIREAEESRRTSVFIICIGGLLNIVFLGASALVFVQQVRAIGQAHADMDALNATLESRVEQRTSELSAARQQLQTVLDSATNVSIIATDQAGIITVFNTGAENQTGYTAEEMVGKRTPGIIHLESEIATRAEELTRELDTPIYGPETIVARALRGLHDEHEWTVVRKDGSHIRINLLVTRLLDSTQGIVGFLGIAMDVTARRKAESEARRHVENFRVVVDSARDYAFVMLDIAGNVVSWNLGAERIKGYTADEIIGEHFSTFYPPEEVLFGRPEEQLRLAIAHGRFAEEGVRRRKDGILFLADVLITAVYGEAGELLGFAQVVRDITEHKRAEERFQLAVEAAPSSMIMVGPDALIRLVNRQTETLFGYDRGDLLGKPLDMLIPTRFRRGHGSLLDGFFAAPTPRGMGVERELFALRKDGSELPIEIGLNPILAAEGMLVLASVQDVSKRKRQEHEAAERTAQLEAANQELEEFAYVASHDLKSPLRVIDNASKWLEEDLGEHLTGEAKESLDLMRTRIKRMEKLLDDLLAYARLGRTDDRRYTEIVSGNVLADNIVGLLDIRQFNVTFSPAFQQIQVARMPVQQILMNLVGNAIKHHDKLDGNIAVDVDELEGCLEFTVRDDGPGIAPQFHQQIFKMFQTLRPRDQVEGSGMGLALVRKLVDLSGGTLSLESAPGAGSTFRFSLSKAAAFAVEAA